MAQWLRHCAANLQVISSNLAHACVYGIYFHGEMLLCHVSSLTSTEAKQLNSVEPRVFFFFLRLV